MDIGRNDPWPCGSDDDQLRALAGTIASGLKLPIDAFVAGVPVRITTIGYCAPAGNDISS